MEISSVTIRHHILRSESEIRGTRSRDLTNNDKQRECLTSRDHPVHTRSSPLLLGACTLSRRPPQSTQGIAIMSHPALPLKFRRKSLTSSDFDDTLPNPLTSSSYPGLSFALASSTSSGAYSTHDSYALESASSTSSSPIAHSIPLPSHPSSPLEYSHSPQIRHNSSPVHGHPHGSSYAHAIRADDWRHADSTAHLSKPVYAFPRYQDKLSPLFPSSVRSTFSYSSPSELGDEWEDPPLTSDLDIDEMRNDHREYISCTSFYIQCIRPVAYERVSINKITPYDGF